MLLLSADLKPLRPPKRLDLQNTLLISSQVSLIVIALLAVMYALDFAKLIVAPVFLGVVIGMMFSPLAVRLERTGMNSWFAAAVIVLLFLLLVVAAAIAFALPLSTWVDRAPRIWESLQLQIASWKDLFTSISAFKKQVTEIAGQAGALTVQVADGDAVESMVTLAPTIVAQMLLFFVSLYFFVGTRLNLRAAILRLCMTRRMRLRTARFFREVEFLIARYLLTITVVNIGLGLCVTLALWAIDFPSPLLWGSMTALLNYIPYVGPAVMTVIVIGISLATRESGLDMLLPPALYLFLHGLESQFVTNQALGYTMTINPFAVFLSLTFWLWLWGPVGGFIAVPSLLIGQALIRSVLPGANETELSTTAADRPSRLAGATA